MKRDIIKIDESLCDGCGLCATGCPEGAIQIVEGKARLVGEVLCDGLGACIGECPVGAITVETREAEAYDERRVLANILAQGPAVLEAHLMHLIHHDQTEYLAIARAELRALGVADPTAGGGGVVEAGGCGCGGHAVIERTVPVVPRVVDMGVRPTGGHGGGCPGSRNAIFRREEVAAVGAVGAIRSELTHWPVQLHLMSPQAPQYREADVVLAADCAAFAAGDFHGRFLRGKALAIACPKLDDGLDVYEEKLVALMDGARINTLSVVIMEVPCCRGLLKLAQSAAARSTRKVPIKTVVISTSGDVIAEQWL